MRAYYNPGLSRPGTKGEHHFDYRAEFKTHEWVLLGRALAHYRIHGTTMTSFDRSVLEEMIAAGKDADK